MAIVLLALWVPTTTHCQLESLLELEALSCCTHEGDATSTAHHEADCSADACADVESGFYKLRDEQGLPSQLPQVIEMTEMPLAENALEVPRVLEAAAAPSESRPSWLFTLRAAPAPRAPSA
jgi:hypothetical protein